jgi:DNA-binding beta-propeller fold protein YncE
MVARFASSRSFTLVELITVIAILAIVVTASVVFVGGYVQDSKRTADKQTLYVLNDALTRYKTEGGSVAALTAQAPIKNVLARLQTPVDWAGLNHQFLQSGKTFIGRSIDALGSGAQYRFTRYDTYTNEPGGSSPAGGGAVWVADSGNNRIQKFNSAGVFQLKFGSSGSGDGQFSYPCGIYIDSGGNVWVADSNNNRIQKFNSAGVFQSKFGSSGSGDGQFNAPSGIFVQ